MDSTTIDDRWLKYIENLPWQAGQLDEASYLAFLRAASLGVDQQNALDVVTERIRTAGDHLRSAKVAQQLSRAYRHVQGAQWVREFGFASRPPLPARPRTAFDPRRAELFADQAPLTLNEAWLKANSPVPVEGMTPGLYLSAITRPGEKILIFTDYRSQGQALFVNSIDGSITEDDRIEQALISGNQCGVWFLSNPVDGESHFNPRTGAASSRSEEAITSFRHAVLESDCQPVHQWLRILARLSLPIISIVASANKSVHALVRVAANSKSDWDNRVRAQLLKSLVPLGADMNALTAIRLTRLPCCRREETSQTQELLWLAPNAEAQPIWKE
jgi:hypothetical protein